MSLEGFVGATPAWWQEPGEVSACIEAGDHGGPALSTLVSVAACPGPVYEALVLVPSGAGDAAREVLGWMAEHTWFPALVLEAPADPGELRARARGRRVVTLRAGETFHLDGAVPGQTASAWRTVPGLPGRIHPSDDMLFPGDLGARGYAKQARGAIVAIERALELRGRTLDDVEGCLDLPSGYGRVTRLLAERIDPGRITACDINREAVAYCASEFGVRPLVSDPDFEGIGFGTYDLVWVGSLVTHLNERLLRRFIGLLPGILRPGGLAVISTLGDYGISDVSRYEPRLAGRQAELEDSYRRTGFAFVAYEGQTELGYAWHTPDMLGEAVESGTAGEVRRVAAWPCGWDSHQDVLVFERA